jgi:hypothetical protein
MKLTNAAAAAVVLAVSLPVLAACGSSPSAPAASHSESPGSAAASSPAASSPATQQTAGATGTTFTITSATSAYQVTLTRVAPTQPASGMSLSTPSDHMVATWLTMTGVSGQSTDNAWGCAKLIGTDQQVYQESDSLDTVAGTSFDAGQFSVGPGETERGVVTWELPAGVSAARVQWSPYATPGAQPVTWHVRA